MALGGEIVDLVRLRLLHDADQVGRIRHVAIVQDELLVRLVRILVEMLDAAGVERRGAALDAVDGVALVEQKLGEIGPVLSGHAGDEGNLADLRPSPSNAPLPGLRASRLFRSSCRFSQAAATLRDRWLSGTDWAGEKRDQRL